LATAGLAAYAAIKSVHDTISSIGNAAAGGARTGRAAFLSGVPVSWLSAFEQYAFQAGNVAPETTEGVLNSFGQKLTAFKTTGEYSPEFTALARFANIGDVRNIALPDLIDKLAGQLGKEGKNGPLAQFLAGQEGFGELTNVLVKGQPALRRGLAEHMPTAVTDQQTQQLQALQGAVNDVQTAWESLIRTIITDNPQWTGHLKKYHDWLVDVQSTPEGLAAVQKAAEIVSVVIGVTLVAAVGKLVQAVLAANASMLKTPLGAALLGIYAGHKLAEFLNPDEPGSEELTKTETPEERTKLAKENFRQQDELTREIGEFQQDKGEDFFTRMRHKFTGYQNLDDFNEWRKQKGYDKSQPLPFIYGNPAAAPAASSSTGAAVGPLATGVGGPSASNPVNIRPVGGDGFNIYPSTQAGLAAADHQLALYGSKHNVTTLAGVISRWSPPNENPTAKLIANAARRTGLDPNQPIDLSDPAVRHMLIDKALLPQEQGDKAALYQSILNNTPLDTSSFVAGGGTSGGAGFAAAVRNYQTVQKTAQSRSTTNNAGNVSSIDNDVNIGSLHLHTNTNDPASHGKQVADSLKSNMVVSNSNTGLF